MKFKISQEEFARALNIATRALSIKASLPVLANIHLSILGGKLEVLATNLETAIKVTTICAAEGEGKITVPGKILVEFVNGVAEGEVEVEQIGEEVVFKARGFNARLATISAEEFPSIPKIEGGVEIKIDGKEFVKMAERVAFSAASDEGRPVLNGVLVTAGKKEATMVATDGFRLSFAAATLAAGASPIKMVVPSKTVIEVAKIITEEGEGEGSFSMLVSQNLSQVNFKIGDVHFTSRLIEGTFPNWEKIIPASFATKVLIPRDDLMKAVRVASIFARDSGNIVKITISGDKLTIAASTNQVGSNEAEIAVKTNGKGGEIAFNFRYLIEALGVIESPEVVFEMSESLTPGKLTSESSRDFFHIIMPVRLQG